MQGRDMIGRARTGTGKTLAFGIPILENIVQCNEKHGRGRNPLAIVMAPTGELACQVEKEFYESAPNLDTLCVYGGSPIQRQMSTLDRGVDVIVGTPGRVIDLLNRATMPSWIVKLTHKYLKTPLTVDLRLLLLVSKPLLYCWVEHVYAFLLLIHEDIIKALEVADELVAEYADSNNAGETPDQQPYDEKNIRRRVYDALNVIMAMDIISKDKKEIQWKGFPRTSLDDIEEIKRERLAIRGRMEKKAAYLKELQDQYEGLQNLVHRNERLYSSGNAPNGGVSLPFILVQTQPHATVEVEISEDMQLVHFDFNSTPFELHDDNYVLKAMKLSGQPELDDMTNDVPDQQQKQVIANSTCSMFWPPSRPAMQSGKPSISPPVPGILKPRVKHGH